MRSVSSLYRPVFPVHHVLFAHGSVGEPARVSASQADGYVTCFSPVRSRVRARASLCPRVTVLLGWFRNSSAGRKTVSEFDLQGVRDSCPARPLQDRNVPTSVQQATYRTGIPDLCPASPLPDRNSRSLSRKTLTGQKFPISVHQDPYRTEPYGSLSSKTLRGRTSFFRHSTRGRVTPSAARLETGTRPNAVGGREGKITVKT